MRTMIPSAHKNLQKRALASAMRTAIIMVKVRQTRNVAKKQLKILINVSDRFAGATHF